VLASEYSAEIPHQRGLAPGMLKYLVGRGHQEFSTMRQQDAYEFLLHLFKLITRSTHTAALPDPTNAFRFVMEHRLQCLNCKRVRYRSDAHDNISIPVPARRLSDGSDGFAPVTLEECLDSFTAEDEVQLACPACGSNRGFSSRALFKTFPDVLAINCRRFQLVNWVPTKLDIPVVVGEAPLSLERYQSKGRQADEELLPDNDDASRDPSSSSSNRFTPHAVALAQLEGMGFPRVRCEKALHATGNEDADAAMNWLFAHMDDPDIDEPVDLHAPAGGSGGGGGGGGGDAAEDPAKVEMLGAMGFDAARARKALRETGGDTERAVDWLFSHPDDDGGDTGEGAVVETAAAAAASDVSQQQGDRPSDEPGNADGPANYQLQSIVCHKGGSIHAG
jgi:ubiquitin carboxyl-terminal hydrolase 5/13